MKILVTNYVTINIPTLTVTNILWYCIRWKFEFGKSIFSEWLADFILANAIVFYMHWAIKKKI